MKMIAPDRGFRPDGLPVSDSIGLRADPGIVSLWLFDSKNVVIAELLISPEDGWELARDIVAMSDSAAGVR